MTLVVRHCGDETEHKRHEWQLGRSRFLCVGTTAEGAEIAKRYRFARAPRAEIAPAPIEWGSTMCARRHCVELAECSIDGEPFCIEHGDEEIERACVSVDFAAKLPELDE